MRSVLALFAALAALSTGLGAQNDRVFVLAGTHSAGANSGAILGFDRRLVLQATVPNHETTLVTAYGTSYGVCTDSQRRLWAPWPSSQWQVLRLDAAGQVIDSVITPQFVSSLVAGQHGNVFGRVNSTGGAMGLDADGDVLWASPFGGAFWWFGWADTIVKPCLTAGGELWFGGLKECFAGESPLLAHVDTRDGGFPGAISFPGFSQCQYGRIYQLAAALDGSMWAMVAGLPGAGFGLKLARTDGASVFQIIAHDSLWNGTYVSPYLCVDGLGQLLCDVFSHQSCYEIWCNCWGTAIRRYDPQLGVSTATYELGGVLHGFTLGPTGEELFAAIAQQPAPASSPARLVRVNLVTGARSTVPMPSEWPFFAVPHGDPTGFVFANTVDRVGDADGDGDGNGVETAAGSNPFNPESRPEGPKVYVSFAPVTNAIAMTLFDPDGLRHATKGIDFGTMSVTVGGSGNVFWALLGFVTEASLSADGKTAHVVFGGLPLASDLKLRVEMSVRDRTGAIGWDWQATPPGDL